MRVAVVTPGRFHLFDLARELIREGHVVTVYTSLPRYYAVRYIGKECHVVGLFHHEIVWRIERWFRKKLGYGNIFQYVFHFLFSWNVRLLFDTSCDRVFVASSFALPLIPLFKKNNIPLILERGSPHILTQDKLMEDVNRIYKTNTERPHRRIISQEILEYEQSWRISVPSSFVKESFLKRGLSENKIVRIGYGVSLEDFRYIPSLEKDNFEGRPIRLIAVGNKTAGKGSQELTEAVKLLVGQGHELNLILVGPTAYDYSTYLASLENPWWLSNYDAVPQKDLCAFYNHADIFLMPSFSEGLALVAIQALACGLPIIATYNSGVGDLIKHGDDGYLYDPGNSEQLADVLRKCIVKKNLISMIKKSRSRSLDNFTWRNYGRIVNSEFCI